MDDARLKNVLEIAIKKEQEAYDFYMDLRKKVADATAKDTLKFMAAEELKHKEFLTACHSGSYCSSSLKMDAVIDYGIIEHVKKPDLKKNMSSAEVYLVAADRELNSHKFYKDRAASDPGGEVRDMLLKMANEELKHKEKVEYLYSNTAFPQTAGG